MGPIWLPNYFCPLYIYRASQYTRDPCDCPIISVHYIYTGRLNIHGTHVTALLYLPTQYMHIYRASQYTWDPCDCPIISAHCIYTGRLNIHRTHVTTLLFLPTHYMHIYRASQYTWDPYVCPIISQNRCKPLFITETRTPQKDCMSWKLMQ